MVRHPNTGLNGASYLNGTSTLYSVGFWNDAAPTSTVFSVGSAAEVNANGGTYVAYCFAEIPGYSRIGAFMGSGSFDGPFIHCGFRPRWYLHKQIDSNWFIYDAARSPVTDPTPKILSPNFTEAEANIIGGQVNFLANGVKIDTGGGGASINNGNVLNLYIALAEAPFKYARAF
jgi:hypothetical protein